MNICLRLPWLRAWSGFTLHAKAQQPVEREAGVMVNAAQGGYPVSGDVEGKEAQKIAECTLGDSPPKEIAIFLSHKSTLA